MTNFYTTSGDLTKKFPPCRLNARLIWFNGALRQFNRPLPNGISILSNYQQAVNLGRQDDAKVTTIW